jgi:hypothetical protein
MTIATVRPDGFPQATVVSFVHDDLKLYFGTFSGSQKALNLAACDKVSCTVTRPCRSWDEIEGLSLGGHGRLVTDPDEFDRATKLLLARFPQASAYGPDDRWQLVMVRIDPVVISLLDYAKGFGHAETFQVQGLLPPEALAAAGGRGGVTRPEPPAPRRSADAAGAPASPSGRPARSGDARCPSAAGSPPRGDCRSRPGAARPGP